MSLLRSYKFWLSFFSILFCFLLLLPFFFLELHSASWITSGHFQLRRGPDSKEIFVNLTQTIGQVFVAPFDNLGRIGLLMHRGENPRDRYIFHLQEIPPDNESFQLPLAKDVRRGTFEVGKIRDIGFFEFEPLPQSSGKMYYFYLEPDTPTHQELGLFTSDGEFLDGASYINHTITSSDLIFQVYFKKNLNFLSFFRVITSRMSQYKPLFFKVPFLYFYWIFFFLSIFFLIRKLLLVFIFCENDWNRLKLRLLFLFFFWLIILSSYLWIQTQNPFFPLNAV
ncbi:hypothetical protein HYV56_01080 [Candidatus Peregrinibacteria bacterium]|nr:hypothetical protein [Candidatus Peregrinibacteria bacterium]